MTDDAKSRAELLKSIRAAELAGAKREESAKARVAQVKAQTQTECVRMVEEAEREGRTAMRKSIEDARMECARVKEAHVSEAVKKGQAKESESKARIPAVADLMYMKFKKEYDVKN